MSHGEVLIELARQVRGDTLQVLDAAHADWLTWSPKETSNHMEFGGDALFEKTIGELIDVAR